VVDTQRTQAWIVIRQIDADAVDPVVLYLDQGISPKLWKVTGNPVEKRVTPEMAQAMGPDGWMSGTTCQTAVRSCS